MNFNLGFSSKSWFVFLCASVASIKLFLVSGNEIIAVPNDSAVFIQHVLVGLDQLGAPSGYPLWLWLVGLVGFPQRVAIEIFYLLSCFFLSFTMIRGFGRLGALILFVVLALNPVTYYLFDNALSDPLYLCLGFVALGFSAVLFQCIVSKNKSAMRASVGFGFVLGLMGVVRNEDILLMGWLFAFFLITVLFLGRKLFAVDSGKFFFPLFVVSVFLFFAVSGAPSVFHYLSNGVWTKTMASMPSHMRLLRNLAKIDSGDGAVKYVTVSKKSRELAYAVSPTLELLRGHIERPDNMYVEASHRVGGLPLGEIGVGWIWHVFNDAALSVIPNPKTVKDLDEFWVNTNREIEAAFNAGRLKSRFVIHPFVKAGVFEPFSNILDGVSVAMDKAFKFCPFQSDQGFEPEAFDKVCNRRAALVSGVGKVKLKIQGWVFSKDKEERILSVQLGIMNLKKGTTEWFDLEKVARPDVDAAFSKEMGICVSSYGYSVEMDHERNSKILLRYVSSSGEIVEKNFKTNSVESLFIESGTNLYRGIDLFELGNHADRSDMRRWLQTAVIDFSGWWLVKWVFFLLAAGGFILFLVLLYFRFICRDSLSAFIGVFVFVLIVLRLIFFALLNENSWEIEPRYMSPIFGMLIVGMGCFLAVLFEFVRGALRKRPISN